MSFFKLCEREANQTALNLKKRSRIYSEPFLFLKNIFICIGEEVSELSSAVKITAKSTERKKGRRKEGRKEGKIALASAFGEA